MILATLFGAISIFFRNDLHCVTALVMIISVLYSIYQNYLRLSRSITRELRNLNRIMTGLIRTHAEMVAEGELLMEYVQEVIATEEEEPTIRMSDYIIRLQSKVESNCHKDIFIPEIWITSTMLLCLSKFYYYFYCHKHGRFLQFICYCYCFYVFVCLFCYCCIFQNVSGNLYVCWS